MKNIIIIDMQKGFITESNKHLIEKINSYLSENQLQLLENKIGRIISSVVFDSKFDQWSVNNSKFFEKMHFQNEFIILIKTTTGRKFGCYISSYIFNENKFVDSYNAFVFSLQSNSFDTGSFNLSRY